jgi:hypothetical protein
MSEKDDPRNFSLQLIGPDDWIIVDGDGEEVDAWKYRTRKMSYQTAYQELSLMISWETQKPCAGKPAPTGSVGSSLGD